MLEPLKKQTVAELFLRSCRQRPQAPAYSVKLRGAWKDISYGQVYNTVKDTSTALWKLGFRRGDVIAILSENRPEWNICDFSIVSVGMICTPVYPTLTAEQIMFILEHSGAGLVFVSDRTQAEKVIQIRDELPNLKYIIVFDNDLSGMDEEGWILSFDKFRSFADREAARYAFKFEEECLATGEDDVFTYIYTSGTTGVPKSVVLTHRNIASNVDAAMTVLGINERDIFLSFLPLSHALERMAGHMVPFRAGAKIAFAEGVNEVPANLVEVRPTVVIAVPRLFEKVYNKIMLNQKDMSPIRGKIFRSAFAVGAKVSAGFSQYGKKPRGFLALKMKIARKLVFSKITSALGGRIRFFVSGGAPLAREIAEFFSAATVTILEGYGLTETSPVTNVNRLERYKFGTVGMAIPDVEVRISDEQEIQVKGPNVMKEYFRDPEATGEVFTEDGWFRTGDIGEIDAEGFLKITGRIKDIIITSGGKNISPANIEQCLLQSPYISQIVVIGDRRNYLTALVVPDMEQVEKIALSKNIQYDSADELLHHYEIHGFFDSEIQARQEDLARFEQIKRFTLLPAEFTIDSGELTPSLKIRRNVVEARYADLIDKMYG